MRAKPIRSTTLLTTCVASGTAAVRSRPLASLTFTCSSRELAAQARVPLRVQRENGLDSHFHSLSALYIPLYLHVVPYT